MPKFSIIIPCFKVEKYICECLDSVLAQAVNDWEAICVDDGSPDGTGIILDEYAARDSRVKVIHQPNGGLSAARNSALDIAKGEWLCYLDSDDLMPPNTLEDMIVTWGECPDADMLRGQMLRFKDGEIVEWPSCYELSINIDDLSKGLTGRYFNGYFQQIYFRRKIFGDIRFVGDSWCEERPYGAKCWARVRKIAEMNHLSYGFRKRCESITSSRMELRHVIGNLAATRDVIKILSGSGKTLDKSILKGTLASWLEWIPYRILRELSRKDRKLAWAYWYDSLPETELYVHIGFWWRFVTRVYQMIPSPILPILLGVFPHWLKLHGIHR